MSEVKDNVYRLPTTAEIHAMRLDTARKYLPSAMPYINEAQTTTDAPMAAFNWREAYQHAMNMLIDLKQHDARDQAEAFRKSDDFCPPYESPLHEVWQQGVSWALERVGKYLGIKGWDADGGSECIEGDVDHEIGSILKTAKLMDPETGDFAKLPEPLA